MNELVEIILSVLRFNKRSGTRTEIFYSSGEYSSSEVDSVLGEAERVGVLVRVGNLVYASEYVRVE